MEGWSRTHHKCSGWSGVVTLMSQMYKQVNLARLVQSCCTVVAIHFTLMGNLCTASNLRALRHHSTMTAHQSLLTSPYSPLRFDILYFETPCDLECMLPYGLDVRVLPESVIQTPPCASPCRYTSDTIKIKRTSVHVTVSGSDNVQSWYVYRSVRT